MKYNNAQHIFAFFKTLNHDEKLVPHFPVLHFPILKIWSLIFQSCRSVELFGPSFSVDHVALPQTIKRTETERKRGGRGKGRKEIDGKTPLPLPEINCWLYDRSLGRVPH